MRKRHWVVCCASLALLAAAGTHSYAQSGGVPKLNVGPVCRGIAQQAATPGEIGGPDLSYSRCVKSEMAMRHKLAGRWATFTADEKANCIGSEMGDFASYTDLATCLQMAQQARKFNR